jgi:hypothetical protein
VISQSDLEGRLRLLRYGLVVVVIVTFMVSLLAPYVATRDLGTSIAQFLGNAVLFTVVVGVIAAVIFFAYSSFLKRSAESGS